MNQTKVHQMQWSSGRVGVGAQLPLSSPIAPNDHKDIVKGQEINELDQGPSNAVIVWKGWSTKLVLNYLFQVPLLQKTKDIVKGQEITHKFSLDCYITRYVAY